MSVGKEKENKIDVPNKFSYAYASPWWLGFLCPMLLGGPSHTLSDVLDFKKKRKFKIHRTGVLARPRSFLCGRGAKCQMK